MYWNSGLLTMAFPSKTGVQLDEPDALSIIYTNRHMPVIQTAIASAFIRNLQLECDHCATYLSTFTDASGQVQPEDIARAFEDSAPAFLRQLFGRKAWHFEKGTNGCNDFTGTTNEMVLNKEPKKLFAMMSLSAVEAVLETKHKHLTITVSLLLAKPRKASAQKNIVLSYAITCHTRLGRFYVTLLKPLFQYIMPALLKQTVQKVTA